MALIGNDFVKWTQMCKSYCSECGRLMPKGSVVLVSMRKGKVMKKVCSEDCRLEFDARFWDQVAMDRRYK
jgi:hypothetical protein